MLGLCALQPLCEALYAEIELLKKELQDAEASKTREIQERIATTLAATRNIGDYSGIKYYRFRIV